MLTTLLVVLMVHGLFLAGLLWFHGRSLDRANGALALMVLAASGLLLESALQVSGTLISHPHLRGWLMPVWLLIGPLAYRYTLAFLERPLPRSQWLLFLPAGALAVWLLPYWMQPGWEKALRPLTAPQTAVLYCVFWMLTAWCAHRSWLTIRDVQRDDPERVAQAPWRFAWLRFLMGAMAAYAALDLTATTAFITQGSYPPAAGVVSVLLLASVVYAVGVLVMMPDGLLARSPWPGRQYAHSPLPRERARQHAAGLESLMHQQRPWQDENLGLADLARLAGMTSHQLSQVLSQTLNTSFADFVNGYRVHEAKRLLREAGSRKNILDIGLEAGFGSSASFYRAFRKHAGVTPKAFLAEAAASNVEPLSDRRDSGR